jgi:hypothetical protein
VKPKVYISVGSAATPRQTEAAEVIFRSLEAAGLSPRQMEKNEWSSEQPLRAIRRVIEECEGIVVIAFARYRFASGAERQKGGGEKPLTDTRMTTVWNQIEAAMGYTRSLPLLVVAENGVLEEGLLEGRYDWKVYWTDFSREQLQSDAFIGYLESWKRLVLAQEKDTVTSAGGGEVDFAKMSLTQLCGRLTLPQLWCALSAFFGLLISVAAAAFRVGSGKWPWQ